MGDGERTFGRLLLEILEVLDFLEEAWFGKKDFLSCACVRKLLFTAMPPGSVGIAFGTAIDSHRLSSSIEEPLDLLLPLLVEGTAPSGHIGFTIFFWGGAEILGVLDILGGAGLEGVWNGSFNNWMMGCGLLLGSD